MLGQTGLLFFQTTWSAQLIFSSSGICDAIICLASEIWTDIRCPKRLGGAFAERKAKPYLTPARSGFLTDKSRSSGPDLSQRLFSGSSRAVNCGVHFA
jgi:hypothetical protein